MSRSLRAESSTSSTGSRRRQQQPTLADDDSLKAGYDSGIGEDSDSGSETSNTNDEERPITGFAVAGSRRNAEFHELFPSVPEDEFLIEDYGCALQREILLQGRLYLSENHISFQANIFGWITQLSIPLEEITTIEKKLTAYVIPNAIQITTPQRKYTFASFLSRDSTFTFIYNIWRLQRPDTIACNNNETAPTHIVDDPGAGPGLAEAVAGLPSKKATQCTCGKENKHYSEVAMDITVPGTPEKIHNLLFASEFIKDFMVNNQKLTEIEMSEWKPINPSSPLLTQRDYSFIKPLTGSFGPKQTKCELNDEVLFHDAEQYISTMTTTRTPNVPSGGVFSVKTRTCITWASAISSRVVVTTQVEWTGRSFVKGIIERSAIDGQKVYHAELERCMRAYIKDHKADFLPEGLDASVVDAVPEATETTETLSSDKPTPEKTSTSTRTTYSRLQPILDSILRICKRRTSTDVLWVVIVGLVITNLWTLSWAGSVHDEVHRKFEARRMEMQERLLQSHRAACCPTSIF
ncbi:GRAM-domain-containing protein, partial [Agrocybe pediades]